MGRDDDGHITLHVEKLPIPTVVRFDVLELIDFRSRPLVNYRVVRIQRVLPIIRLVVAAVGHRKILLPAQNKGTDAPRPDGRYALVLEGAQLIVCVTRIGRAAYHEEEESEHGLMQHDGEKTARAQSDV